jgi:TfoX/Sxy family transcriptional regulator of competence genes
VHIPKPTDADRQRFHKLVPDDPNVEVKPMFGNLGAFVNGNMFMGLFGSDIGVKLDEPDRAKLAAVPGTGPFGPAERPMGGYVTLPAGWTARQAGPWISKAHAAAAALPPKKPKKKTAKKAGK